MKKIPEYLLISFMSTKYSLLKEHWARFSVLNSEGKRGSNKPFLGEMGGKISLLRWKDKKIVWEMDVPSPSGICQYKNLIFVNSINLGCVIVIDPSKNKIIDNINNKYLNKPHSLVKTKRGFLITSTGLDLIIEIDEKGNSIFEYWLTSHGYNKDQFGNKRIINKKKNHQKLIYPSLNQTTHVNFAHYINPQERTILASLFHNGEIIKINKQTGKLSPMIKDLNHPHNINNYSNTEYLICDTDNDTILRVNKHNFSIKKTYGNKTFSWIQDAIKFGNRILIADADNSRVVEIEPKYGSIKSTYKFSDDYRIFSIIPALIDKNWNMSDNIEHE